MTRPPMWLVLSALGLGGACAEPEGPAVEVFLQIVRAEDQTDTSDVKTFLIEVDGVRRTVAFDPDEPPVLAFTAAPHSDTAFVVYACPSPISCAARFADFVGCTVVDLAPSEVGVPVTVRLADIASPPAACAGLLDG